VVHVTGAAHLGGSNKIAVNAGLARVAIRSTAEVGSVKVVAMGKGLKPGELKLKAE